MTKQEMSCPHKPKVSDCAECMGVLSTHKCENDHSEKFNLITTFQGDGTQYDYCYFCQWVDIKSIATQTNQELITEIIRLVSSLEVKSLPSDDPELRYWQGYADAQLDITNLIEDLK